MSTPDTLRIESVTPILSVLDLPRALAFYEEKLGFSRAWTWGDPIELAGICRGQVELNLGARGKLGPQGPSQVYLRVSPIGAWWELAKASGAELLVEIADRPYGLRDFSIRDESGNRLDFGEPIREA
jgi:uncharacterized glyoxalase superfamily protein PhnB